MKELGKTGTTANKTDTAINGVATNITSEAPEKSGGYVFSGWSTSSSATEADYLSGKPITITEDTTLYAVYKAAEVASITLSVTSTKWISYKSGSFTVYATVTMTDEDATIPDVTWSSGSTSVISLSSTTTASEESITVTAKDAGGTYIQASAGGVSSSELYVRCYNCALEGTYPLYALGNSYFKCGEKWYIDAYYVSTWISSYNDGYLVCITSYSYRYAYSVYHSSGSCSADGSHNYKFVYQSSLP